MRAWRTWIVGCIAVVLVGCAANLPSRVDRNWGSAQLDNTAAMIVNPVGTRGDQDPTAEMDGFTVQDAVGAFRATQKQRQSEPSSVINIGSIDR